MNGATEREGLAAFDRCEIRVARAERKAVGVANDGADDDFRGEAQIGNHAAEDGDLGCVLLAEEGEIGLGGDEELGDDGGNAAKMAGARCAVEAIAEAGDLDKGAVGAVGVKLFDRGSEENVGPDSTFVEVPSLSNRLDGASRPGHFRGVATVVARLLIAAEPNLAFFGQKDAAQIAVLRRMVADLRLGAEVVVCPIVRDADGLALSSRNAYLSPAERTQALTLSRAIGHVESLAAQGERRADSLLAAAHEIFAAEPAVRIDFIALVDWSTLLPVATAAPGTLFAVAAYVGSTRLIDNTVLA